MAGKDSGYRKRTIFFMIWVFVLIFFMLFSFYWLSEKTNEDSSNASLKTSRIYLKELNKQTVFYFNERIHDLEERGQMVCNGLNPRHLESEEALRRNINRVLSNNGFPYFAYLDKDKMLHGIESVKPVSKNLKRLDEIMKGDEIITAYNTFKNGDNYLVISVPIHDAPFEDTEIIAGVFGYSLDVLSQELSLERDEASTYSSVIHANGDYIINTPIKGMEKDNEILELLKNKASFMEGYSYEDFIRDFHDGKNGMTVYDYAGTTYYTYYSSVPDYNWRIVTTIPYDVIGYTLDGFYNRTTRRSQLMMIIYLFIFLLTLYGYSVSSKKTEEILRRANNAKSEFLSRMSHEIRTPMNGIMGLGELAKRAIGDNKQVLKYLDEQSEVSANLLGIINDVLDMSRIESGKIEIVNECFDLRATLRGIANSYGVAAIEKGVAFDICLEEEVKQFYIGDELRLVQILGNLCSNATKFTEPGGKILLTVKRLDREGACWLEFSVKDTGCGIHPDNQARIFEAFEQENANTVNKFGGTGLGLSIVKNFTALMGGEISLWSKPDEGSDFRIRLPFTEIDFGEDYSENKELQVVNEQDMLTENAIEDSEKLRGMHILFAEDNMLNRMIGNDLLSSAGAVVDNADDGLMALEMFRSSSEDYYDIILMDIQMPVMNGHDATRHIRALKRSDALTVPVYAMSANAFQEDIDNSIESGMNGHFAKPINTDELMTKLSEIYSTKHAKA